MGKGEHQIPSNINRESKKGFVVKVEIRSYTLDPNLKLGIEDQLYMYIRFLALC